jgi:hypothetical protein
MEKVERQLPNGFHDGTLRRLSVDQEARTLTLEVEFWIGENDEEQHETYRLGRVTIAGLSQLVADEYASPPESLTGEPIIDGGEGEPETDAPPVPLVVPPGSFSYWLLVEPGYIRFVGETATLEWLGEPFEQ